MSKPPTPEQGLRGALVLLKEAIEDIDDDPTEAAILAVSAALAAGRAAQMVMMRKAIVGLRQDGSEVSPESTVQPIPQVFEFACKRCDKTIPRAVATLSGHVKPRYHLRETLLSPGLIAFNTMDNMVAHVRWEHEERGECEALGGEK